MTNLDSVLKSRDITLPTKIHRVKAMVFAVVMYRCESWTMKKADYQRIDAFELWCCWEPLAQQEDQTDQSERKSILNIHWKGWYEAETPILWPPDVKNWLLEGKRRRGQQRMRRLDGITESMDEWTLGVGDGQGGLVCCDSWGRKESDTTERLNWTELMPQLAKNQWRVVLRWKVKAPSYSPTNVTVSL